MGQRLAAQSLGLDGEPAPLVVREPETLAPKPGSEHTVLLLLVVDHILLLAVEPSQLERAVGIARGTSSWILKITPSGQTIAKSTALGPVANTDTKLLIYGLFQKGRVLAQDGVPPHCYYTDFTPN